MPRTFSLESGPNATNGMGYRQKEDIKDNQETSDRQTPLPSPDNLLTRTEPRQVSTDRIKGNNISYSIIFSMKQCAFILRI